MSPSSAPLLKVTVVIIKVSWSAFRTLSGAWWYHVATMAANFFMDMIIYKYKSIILAPFTVAALAHGQILDRSKSAMVRVRQTLVLV